MDGMAKMAPKKLSGEMKPMKAPKKLFGEMTPMPKMKGASPKKAKAKKAETMDEYYRKYMKRQGLM